MTSRKTSYSFDPLEETVDANEPYNKGKCRNNCPIHLRINAYHDARMEGDDIGKHNRAINMVDKIKYPETEEPQDAVVYTFPKWGLATLLQKMQILREEEVRS